MHKTQKKSKAYGSKEGHSHFNFICPVIVKYNYAWIVNFSNLNAIEFIAFEFMWTWYFQSPFTWHDQSSWIVIFTMQGIKGIFKKSMQSKLLELNNIWVSAALICLHWNWIPLLLLFFFCKAFSPFIGVRQRRYYAELFINAQFDSAAAIFFFVVTHKYSYTQQTNWVQQVYDEF